MEGRRSKRPRLMSTDDDKKDKQMTTRLQERRLREESLRYVLNNHVICENIASYLSLSDMKAASLVSRQFLQAVRGTQRFAQVAVLAITDKNPQDIRSTLRKTEFSWRGVKIDVKVPSDILDDLPRLLKSVEFVCLGTPSWKLEDYRVKNPTAVSLLTTVLSSRDSAPQLSPFRGIQPFKLSHFQLHLHFLFTNLRSALSSPAVQETLRNLTHLDILDTNNEDSTNIPHFINDEDADEEKEPFAMNLRLLTGLPNRLKSFSLPELFPERNGDKNSVNRSALSLFKTNRTTMEELTVDGKVWELPELKTLTFPVLKTLNAIVCKPEEEETLANFLENQRSLEELTVASEYFNESLVSSIRSRCLELKKLDLTTENSIGNVEEWSFLGSMNRLKEFRFKIREIAEDEEDGVTNVWRLLAFLPKNQLESLSLEGSSTRNYRFWRGEGGVEAEFGVKTELLEGFRCLRKLSFLGSWNAVDDQLMQWILTEFVSLEDLEISDCGDLSNAGLSGDTRAEWGRNASLSDLRGLKTLNIQNCLEVTLKGVASCVKLPFLKSLVYSPPWILTPEIQVGVATLKSVGRLLQVRDSVVLLDLAGRNPRLESLSLDYRGEVDDLEKLKAKMMKKNPRVELLFTKDHELPFDLFWCSV